MTELARKHRVRPEMLAERHERTDAELSALSGPISDLDAMRQQHATKPKQTFRTSAAELSSKRRRSAKKFAREVSAHLDSLGITGGSLELVFTDGGARRRARVGRLSHRDESEVSGRAARAHRIGR